MKTTNPTAAHTPGPWIVAPSSNNGNGTAWRDILSTGTEFAPSYVGEALEQDARLIASAPDLLAALENVLMYCVTPKGMPDANKGRSAEQQFAYDQARAAIAAARG